METILEGRHFQDGAGESRSKALSMNCTGLFAQVPRCGRSVYLPHPETDGPVPFVPIRQGRELQHIENADLIE